MHMSNNYAANVLAMKNNKGKEPNKFSAGEQKSNKDLFLDKNGQPVSAEKAMDNIHRKYIKAQEAINKAKKKNK
jgi:hypothetical protein